MSTARDYRLFAIDLASPLLDTPGSLSPLATKETGSKTPATDVWKTHGDTETEIENDATLRKHLSSLVGCPPNL